MVEDPPAMASPLAKLRGKRRLILPERVLGGHRQIEFLQGEQ